MRESWYLEASDTQLARLKQKMLRGDQRDPHAIIAFYQAIVRAGKDLSDPEYGIGASTGRAEPKWIPKLRMWSYTQDLWPLESLPILFSFLLTEVRRNPEDSQSVKNFWEVWDWMVDTNTGGIFPDVPLQIVLQKESPICPGRGTTLIVVTDNEDDELDEDWGEREVNEDWGEREVISRDMSIPEILSLISESMEQAYIVQSNSYQLQLKPDGFLFWEGTLYAEGRLEMDFSHREDREQTIKWIEEYLGRKLPRRRE